MFPSIFINRTPKVARPVCETLPALKRMITPLSVINKMSSSPVTVVSPASGPFFSLTLAVLIPLPPRPLTGYSEAFVRLP